MSEKSTHSLDPANCCTPAQFTLIFQSQSPSAKAQNCLQKWMNKTEMSNCDW